MRSLRDTTLSAAFLFACFLIGSVLGCVLAFIGQPGLNLRVHLSEYFLLVSKGPASTSLWTTLFSSIRWPIAIFVAAFTPFATALIPGLLLLRGFLLTYTATCLSLLFSKDGWIMAIILLSAPLAMELPAIFMISCECLCGAKSRSASSDTGNRRYLRMDVLLVGGGLLVIAVAAQMTVIPELFSTICAQLFT